MENLDQNMLNMQSSFTTENVQVEQQEFITKVYAWMSVALLLTGITSIFVASTPALMQLIFGNSMVFYGLLIFELVMVLGLSFLINKINSAMATFLFILYSVVNGITLSFIFLIYTQGSIASTFLITSLTFGAMSAYGYFTKKDLTSWGNLLGMALLGLIIASVVNIFMKSDMLMWITTFAGIIIFVGLTAYDTQKIKNMNMAGASEDVVKKGAIMGALTLYLDFINLFLKLLRLFGRRK